MFAQFTIPPEALTHLPELGVGGGLAAFIFYFYRLDRKASDRLATSYKEIIQENTKAITALTELIRDRKE